MRTAWQETPHFALVVTQPDDARRPLQKRSGVGRRSCTIAAACRCLSPNRPSRSASSGSRRSATRATRFPSCARSKTRGRARRSRGSSARPSTRCSRGSRASSSSCSTRRKGLRGYAAVHRALGRATFDALLHMHASTRANLVSTLVRAPLRIGFDRARARDQQWLFTNTKLPARRERHVMDGLFEFAELIGVQARQAALGHPRRRRRRRRHRAAVRDRQADARDQPVHGPTISQLPQLARGLVCRDRRLRGAALRRARARHGRQHGHRAELRPRHRGRGPLAAQNLIGKTTLKQLLAILARASVVLCPDSGPAHMATAVGTPVVGLYATSNRHRTGPYFSQHLVVDKYPEAVAARVRPAHRDAALGPARPRPGRHEPDYGGRRRRLN